MNKNHSSLFTATSKRVMIEAGAHQYRRRSNGVKAIHCDEFKSSYHKAKYYICFKILKLKTLYKLSIMLILLNICYFILKIQSIRPSRQSIFPSRQSIFPSRQSIFPSWQSTCPSWQSWLFLMQIRCLNKSYFKSMIKSVKSSIKSTNII